VVVEFASESFWHLHRISYKPVLPKHVFEVIGTENWNTWQPTPPADEIVTSGPYNVSLYVEGEFVEMTRNPNFFYGVDHDIDTTTTTTTDVPPDFTMAIVAGAVGAAVVILVGGYVLMRQK
jgi:ABC-type transport system substrate-binding protein